MDQTRKEQGTWPRNAMVSMLFKHEANLIVMMDLLKVMKEELDKAAYDMNGQRVKARLEVIPQRRALTKAQAMFFNGLKEVDGDESKVRSFYGKLQTSFFVEGDLAAKYTREGEGPADEGWFIDKDVVSNICTDFQRRSL